jgi:hypothetical protein
MLIERKTGGVGACYVTSHDVMHVVDVFMS